LYGAETWTFPKVDQKYLGSFEKWYWRRMEKIRWSDRVRNGDVFHRDKVERNMLHKIKRRQANWIGDTLHRNCLLKHVIERKIDCTGRRGRRHKQLLDELKKNKRYWSLKEEALDRTIWRTRFGRGCCPVGRQTTE
jgi:hypothetical protein